MTRQPIGLSCLVALLAWGLSVSGCAFGWKSVKEKELEEELIRLRQEHAGEILRLGQEKEQAAASAARAAAQEKERQSHELVEAEKRLAESLKKELSLAQAKLVLTEQGLVLTFLDEIFFDSGKAMVKEEGYGTLAKVAQVLQETVPDSLVAVEGHTDNEPIKYSGWRSNWELSSARALAVVHFFADTQGVAPGRLRAVAFGEFHPVASNDTPEARRQNRRVEVVILPKLLKKEKSLP